MKKSLLAVAAMGAFASAAQAQSSVTVYGILDVGYMSQTQRASGTPRAQGAAGANNSVGTTASGFGSSAESTSRLGFRGNEDMGGGTSAIFTVEFGLTPTDSQSIGGGGSTAGNTGSAANLAGGGLNNRQSFVGIKKNGIGAVTIGTQYTPIHEAVAITDPGAQNNMPGNLVYASDLSINSNMSQFPAPSTQNAGNFNTAQAIGGPGGGSAAYIVRSGNALKFVSDSFAGFTGKLMYAQSNSTTNSTTPGGLAANTGGNVTNTLMAAGINYSLQKFTGTVNYAQAKAQAYASTALNANGINTTLPVAGTAAAAQSAGTTTVAGTTWGVGSTAQNVIEVNQYVGATYDFGILKAYAQYIGRKAEASWDGNVYSKRTAQQVGVRSFVTPTIEPWASIGTGKVTNSYYATTTTGAITNGGTNVVGANLSAWQLGTNYYLSKRTNLYAIYGQQQTGNAVYPASVNGNTLAINANSNKMNAYALGMRHTF
jgi:predicted porin